MSEIKNCKVIQDLMPLVIDEACSEESRELVKKHIEKCKECEKVFFAMSAEAPKPVADENAKSDFKKSIRRVKRKTLWLKILAACLGVLVLLAGISIVSNPDMLFYTPMTSAPASWFISPHLVRTKEGAVLLQFTPSKKMKNFYESRGCYSCWDNVLGNAESDNETGRVEIEFNYPWVARLLGLAAANPDVARDNRIMVLSNGDWVYPLGGTMSLRFVDGTIRDTAWRTLTADEIKEQVANGVEITGDSLIFDYNDEYQFAIQADGEKTIEWTQKKSYESAKMYIVGGGQKTVFHQPGEEIPLCDQETEEKFQKWLKLSGSFFPDIGEIIPDGQS